VLAVSVPNPSRGGAAHVGGPNRPRSWMEPNLCYGGSRDFLGSVPWAFPGYVGRTVVGFSANPAR